MKKALHNETLPSGTSNGQELLRNELCTRLGAPNRTLIFTVCTPVKDISQSVVSEFFQSVVSEIFSLQYWKLFTRILRQSRRPTRLCSGSTGLGSFGFVVSGRLVSGIKQRDPKADERRRPRGCDRRHQISCCVMCRTP